MYKLNVMTFGNFDPCHNAHAISADKLHIWKCNFNKYGRITSCKLIRENCADQQDWQGLREVWSNVRDAREYVWDAETRKKIGS